MKSRIIAKLQAVALLTLAAGVAACSVDDQEAPGFIGPSGLAHTVIVSATPHQLPRDGASSAVVTVTVQNNGQAAANQRIAFSVAGGTLSAAEATTDSSGRATVTVTAPPGNVPSTRTTIDVFATPIDARGNPVSASRAASIVLTGVPNTTAPTPAFTVDPQAPSRLQRVVFDASGTQDEGAACTSCTFLWDFGGEATATERVVTYRFQAARVYAVTLTVIDASGTAATLTRNVTVGDAAAPTVTLNVAPDPAQAGALVTLTATATPAAGHSITQYEWNLGDGRTATTSSPSITHTYSGAGTYVATVTVTDDIGQTGSAARQLTVSSGAPTATISVSPTDPVSGQAVSFRAINPTTTGGATITSYEWDFGDGSSASGQSVSHAYATANSFQVRLTITDSNGRTNVVTQSVTVAEP